MPGTRRHTARLVTLSFLLRDGAVLLRRHAADGDRFRGLWNGIGGHVEPGEDVRAAARREVVEETGLLPTELSLRGVVHESGLVGADHVLFVFTGMAPAAPLDPERGIELAWQPLDRLDALPLVPDVAMLLPRAVACGEVFFATETFDGGDAPIDLRFDEPGAAHVG